MTSTMVKCMFCGDHFIYNDLLYPHWGKHMNAFVHKYDVNGYAIIGVDKSNIGFMYVLRRFPQLSLAQINNISDFWSKMIIILGEMTFAIYDLNVLFHNLGKYIDIGAESCKLINTTNYHCGLCGGKYDCGLPSMEIATKHAIKCYENLNRPIIK